MTLLWGAIQPMTTYFQLLPREVIVTELAPLLRGPPPSPPTSTPSSATFHYRLACLCLSILLSAAFLWLMTVYWPMREIPCIPYNCTFAPYKDRDETWCDGDRYGYNGTEIECVWGVDIGYGQSFWPWSAVFFRNGTGLMYTQTSSTPPYPNNTLCYHPPPLDPSSWNYCGPPYLPNWPMDWNCMPVMECRPEKTYSVAFITVLSVLCVAFFLFHVSLCVLLVKSAYKTEYEEVD